MINDWTVDQKMISLNGNAKWQDTYQPGVAGQDVNLFLPSSFLDDKLAEIALLYSRSTMAKMHRS